MLTIGRLLPIHRPMALGWAFCSLLVVLALAFRWSWGPGELRQTADATITVSVPSQPADQANVPPDPAGAVVRSYVATDHDDQDIAGEVANPAFTKPAADPIRPAAPDLELVDASPFGPLPRISTDGRRPLFTYGRPFDRTDTRPKVAIMVSNLGPQADATNATIHLPAAISLSFSPYTDDLPSLFERARLAGHEVLLELPMEPADYPASDPGPHTLRASGTVDANIERLSWILARAPGYFAVAGQGGAFADSPEAAPVIEAIAAKGVGMIEIDGEALADEGTNAELAYTTASIWIDEEPSADAIDQALADLEAKAREEGTALGVAEAYPITLQRLVDWAASLEQRGIVLMPASAILIERAGLLSEDDEASNLAQTRN